MENFNLTPSPALLDLLGKIPYKGWQCVAELIDNSIDAIISYNDSLKEYQKVIVVNIPTKSRVEKNEPLIVEDWGIGMTEEQLENAVKAGFSNKNTRTNLGLFGMGFNVATSRLANIVEVWTSTKEMEKEVGVRIDLREMKKTGSFIRPKMERPKRFDKVSGTKIEIYEFKPEAASLLQPKQIIRELNRSYSERIFLNNGIKIIVNNEEISPYKFCVWNKDRSVKYKHEDIPAIIEINEVLGHEFFCESCLSWIETEVETSLTLECPHCLTAGRVIKKEIYVGGWVGIQRYSDTENYGIDISRNGRILSKLDKSFFYWEREPEDSRFNPEYPRDTTYAGGRIVGQIEVDFIVPKYTKDDFERDDLNWKKVVKLLRGDMPLQPELANDFGFNKPNRTPIGLLFGAYRKINNPGTKTLCFARDDGGVDHTTPRSWATLFYDGDPEYQEDTKWWEAVMKADLKDTPSTFNPLNPLGQKPQDKKPSITSEPEPEKNPGKKILKNTIHYDIENIINEKPIDLVLIDYFPENEEGNPIIFESKGSMWKFDVYLNNYHPMVRDFADGFSDLIFMEVAYRYSVIKNSPEWPITRIYFELKSKYASETMLSVQNLVTKASTLMRDIQNKLVLGHGIALPHKPNLTKNEEMQIRQKYLDLEGKIIPDFEKFISNSSFLKYLDLNYVFKFIEDFPEIIFDGNVFTLPYNNLDEQSKAPQVKKYSGYFNDVHWFMNDLSKEGDEALKKLKPQIIRNRYSIEILYANFVK